MLNKTVSRPKKNFKRSFLSLEVFEIMRNITRKVPKFPQNHVIHNLKCSFEIEAKTTAVIWIKISETFAPALVCRMNLLRGITLWKFLLATSSAFWYPMLQ